MRKFKVGDRVTTNLLSSMKVNCTLSDLFKSIVLKGTIKGTSKYDDTCYAVELDDRIVNGHTCDGNCKSGYGWWFVEANLMKEEQ